MNEFLRGALTCLFFTSDEEDFPEYCYSGEFSINQDDIDLLDKEDLDKLSKICDKFQEKWKDLLDQAGDDFQNGCDFIYELGGHGVGFQDRGYGETGDKLSNLIPRSPIYLYRISEDKLGIDCLHAGYFEDLIK